MIHSLAGGDVTFNDNLDFAKVKLLDGLDKGNICWYITNIIDLKVGDIVLVPYGRSNVQAEVLRIDKNVSVLNAPVSVKRAKEILRKININ